MAPLADGDHSELDESELLDPDNIRKHQSILGGLQWCGTLGRFNIQAATATMPQFAQAPIWIVCIAYVLYLDHFMVSGI